VWELKYHNTRQARALAGAYLQETVVALCAEEVGRVLLVPMPMHPKRQRVREHNQTETLCKALLPHLGKGVDYAPEALKKTLDTPTQQGLTRVARMKNVAHSMVASPKDVKGRVCVVIDDVTTTGATLEEARRALLQGGARMVHTVALARS
jgi:predicted amidophosphoribosyltransferase